RTLAVRADGEDFRVWIGRDFRDALRQLAARQRQRALRHARRMFERLAHIQQQRAGLLALQRLARGKLAWIHPRIIADHAGHSTTTSPRRYSLPPSGSKASASVSARPRSIPEPCFACSVAHCTPSSSTCRLQRANSARTWRLCNGASRRARPGFGTVVMPSIVRNANRTNTRYVTAEATGLPGKPKYRHAPISPNSVGMPGFRRTLWKWISPMSRKTPGK